MWWKSLRVHNNLLGIQDSFGVATIVVSDYSSWQMYGTST